MRNEILRIDNVSKSFPGVIALEDINLNVFKGEVLALVGENGAGKSTMMKILSGIYAMDKGAIYFEGKPVTIRNPFESQKLGISIIHQELNQIMDLSITENLFVGREISKNGIFVNKKKANELAKQALETVGLDIEPTTPIRELSIAQRQMVEIARAISFNAKLVIMDEPTSSLTENETEILMDIIKSLCEKDVSVIFISHKLDEVLKISNRITALRDGHIVGTYDTQDCTEEKLISLLVGREIDSLYPKTPSVLGDTVLKVKDLTTNYVSDISFELKKGEIVGFAGLVGAGRTELARAIFGVDEIKSGTIEIDGKAVKITNPGQAVKNGIALVSEDRKLEGLVLGMTIRENVSMPVHDVVSNGIFISNSKETQLANESMETLSIKAYSAEQKAGNLSGGNQQKVVISKWLATKPKILILDEPTRGIDVGAKKEIHAIIDKLSKQGLAVMMISSELPEILGMSDRIIVMNGGRIKGEISRQDATQENIMKIAVSMD